MFRKFRIYIHNWVGEWHSWLCICSFYSTQSMLYLWVWLVPLSPPMCNLCVWDNLEYPSFSTCSVSTKGRSSREAAFSCCSSILQSLTMIRSSEGFNIPILLLISMTEKERFYSYFWVVFFIDEVKGRKWVGSFSDIKLCPLSTTGSRSKDSMLSGNGSNFTENTQF